MTATQHLHLDALGGVAGDMFVAALLHAAPELHAEAEIVAAGITPGLALRITPGRDGRLAGMRLRFDMPDHGHGPHHYADYQAALSAAAPDPGTATRAADILRRLGEAEAEVHGVPLAQVHFHEVADWDSVADVLLAGWLLERLNIATASVGTLPLGSGRVQTEHGVMPVPAPATIALLRGFELTDDGIPGERITPTGAAILAHLSPIARLPGPMTLARAGYGFGHRRMPGLANALRATLWQPTAQGDDVVGVITFTIDDQTGEDLATALDRIRAADGMLDAIQIPAFGKKGRMAVRVEVLCRRDALDDVARLCLTETTTLGLRMHEERRMILSRSAARAGDIRTKTVNRPDGTQTVKAEADDIAQAGDHAARHRARQDAEGHGHDHASD